MDKKQITAMVLIDLSKAFDSLCHSTHFVNYKTWVPPTKLFFGWKVILQTDNGPRVHGKALKDQLRISLVLLNNHEMLLAI